MAESQPIPLARIEPNPNPVRDPELNSEFVDDIRRRGILQSIIVRPLGSGDKYQVVAGMRRFRAAKKLGLKDIQCQVRELTDTGAFFASLAENLQREEMTARDVAAAILYAHDGLHQTTAAVAKELQKSDGDVRSWLAVARNPKLMDHLLRNRLGFEMTLALQRGLDDCDRLRTSGRLEPETALRLQKDFLNESKRLRVRDLERLVRKELEPYLPDRVRQASLLERDREQSPHDLAIERLISKFGQIGARTERGIPQPDLVVRFTSEESKRVYGCSGLWVEVDDTHDTSVHKVEKIQSILGSDWRVMVHDLKTGKDLFFPDVKKGKAPSRSSKLTG
jgi:ParB family transcriptional regulator, chromosome partitioning protein